MAGGHSTSVSHSLADTVSPLPGELPDWAAGSGNGRWAYEDCGPGRMDPSIQAMRQAVKTGNERITAIPLRTALEKRQRTVGGTGDPGQGIFVRRIVHLHDESGTVRLTSS